MTWVWDVPSARHVSALPDDIRVFGTSSERYVVGPALFDPQVNGFAGVDFQDPDLTRDALEHAVIQLQNHACSHCLLTLITADVGFMANQLARISEWLDDSPLLCEAIPGFHLEGPFLSPEEGYIGAHDASACCPPELATFSRLQAASRNRIRMMTMALEPKGSFGFIRDVSKMEVWISIGHSNPSLPQLDEACRAGARSFTHLGNGCPATLHRHENIVQHVLATPGLSVSLIPDGHHVPAPALGNLSRALGASRLFFTTDAMSAAGAPNGRYRFAHLELEVGEDRVVRLPGTRQFAGSCLTPLEGFYNTVVFGGCSVSEAWRAWTWMRDALLPGLESKNIAIAL